MAVEAKMIDIIVEQLSVDREKVVPGASFVDDLGADLQPRGRSIDLLSVACWAGWAVVAVGLARVTWYVVLG